MKRWIVSGLVFACLAYVTMGSSYKGLYVSQFLPEGTGTLLTTAKSEDTLIKKIKAYSESHSELPIDAKLDPTWKAIPGYNGRTVNVKASYNNMKSNQTFDPNKIVYQEVQPRVHLSSLSPNPIYRGNPKKPMVSLVIDVTEDSNPYLPQLLKTLNNDHVKATFFLSGKWVKTNPRLAMLISEEGHAIGSMGYESTDFSSLSRNELTTELKKTNDTFEAVLDLTPRYVTPPKANYNQQTLEAANSLGMQTVLWSLDTLDWKHPDPATIIQRVNEKVESGTIVLMHATKESAESLGGVIEIIEQKGYSLGALPDLLSEERVGD